MQITAFPGEVFELGLEVLDEIDRTTFSVIRLYNNVGIKS